MLLRGGLEGDEMAVLHNPLEGDLIGADVVAGSDGLDNCIAGDVSAVVRPAEGRVGLDRDTMLLAESDGRIVVSEHVVLDLIHSWLHLGHGQNGLQVGGLEVADADGSNLALGVVVLENTPGFSAGGILREVDEHQVHVVHAEQLEIQLDGCLCQMAAGNFGGDEKFLPRDVHGSDDLSHHLLVLVDQRCVDALGTQAQPICDDSLGSRCLESSSADRKNRHLDARSDLHLWNVEWIRTRQSEQTQGRSSGDVSGKGDHGCQ
mmetsp:Transcript_7690/g.11086  ORF Transcript_7690/g.11086 Transcript_7690/m.11086 type:complete len:262 (+) Transcript_7690:641-1426(+)